MTDRSIEPTRRQLLGAVAGAGTIGATAGVTAARFSSAEHGSVTIQAGEVSVRVDCSECVEENGDITVSFDDLEPGDEGDEQFGISIAGNPSRLWLKTECPPAVDPLGEALRVRLSLSRGGDDTSVFPPDGDEFGSLDDLRAAFSDGLRLDDRLGEPCLSPDDELSLGLEYELPASADWTADLQTALSFRLFATQCRGVAEDDLVGPFADATTDCPALECPDCIELGKVDVDGDRLDPGSYAFDELEAAFDDESTYELEVLTVTNKVDSDEDETVCASIRLLKDGEEEAAPPICGVTVGGGRPRHPPSDSDSRVASYDVEPPSTRTRREVCAAHGEAKADPESVDDGARPGISNISVSVCPEDVGDDGGEKP